MLFFCVLFVWTDNTLCLKYTCSVCQINVICEENTNAVASYALSVPSGGYMSDWGDGSKTSSGQKSTYETWTFEPVESLPVTITSAGYATFYCPVAVTLPDDLNLKAYAVSETTDAQMIYWTLIPHDFSQGIKQADIKIHTNFNISSKTEVWGYGNYGRVIRV